MIAASAREVWHLTQQHLASSVTQLLQHAPVFPSLSPQFADIFRCFVLEMTDYCWLLSFFFVLAQWFVTHIACDQNITPLPHPLQAWRRNISLCTFFLFFLNAKWHGGRMTQHVLRQRKRAVRVGILWKYHVILNTTFTGLVYLLLFMWWWFLLTERRLRHSSLTPRRLWTWSHALGNLAHHSKYNTEMKFVSNMCSLCFANLCLHI